MAEGTEPLSGLNPLDTLTLSHKFLSWLVTAGNGDLGTGTVQQIVDLVKADLVGTAPEILDTIYELAAWAQNNEDVVVGLINQLALKAALESPIFTGTPTAPTPSLGDNSDRIATTAFVMAVISSLNIGQSVAILEDQKASASDGGTATAGSWLIRDINTELYDPDGLVSISSNTFTPSADCLCFWSCPFAATQGSVTRIYNVTDSTVVGEGSSEYSHANYPTGVRSRGYAVLEGGKTYRIEYKVAANRASSGLGVSNGFGIEVYSQVLLRAI